MTLIPGNQSLATIVNIEITIFANLLHRVPALVLIFQLYLSMLFSIIVTI